MQLPLAAELLADELVILVPLHFVTVRPRPEGWVLSDATVAARIGFECAVRPSTLVSIEA